MKTIKQLLRQPLKTIAGILVMTLAASILCVCAGQALAAKATKAELDSRFSTAAIPSVQEDLEGVDQILVEQEMVQWLNQMAQEHPDIVQGVIEHGLLSAVIPELLPYNKNAESVPVKDKGKVVAVGSQMIQFLSYTSANHYDSAMLTISLEEISQIYAPDYALEEMESPDRKNYDTEQDYLLARADYARYLQLADQLQRMQDRAEGYTVELTGTITQVLSLQDGLRKPVGMTARLYLILPTREEIEALKLEVGQQYIVYGMDYVDEYRSMAASMKNSKYKHIAFEPFDPSLLTEPTDQQRASYNRNQITSVEKMYNYVPLTLNQYRALNSISMTLCLPGSLGGDGTTEYHDRYAVPTIAKLNGSVEDFLNSAPGASWRQAIERDEKNNHAFSVVGVENMDYLATFALGKSKIGEGREFTPEEVAAGAKVCIVHELVAQMAGLQLGDAITLNFYSTDHNLPYAKTRAENKGLLCPAASLYFDTTPILETAEYTVVGFWQGDVDPDVLNNYYSFNANTVFVPQSSVATPMEQVNTLPFVVGRLENGQIMAFHNLAKRSGYAGCFKYTDQDFTKIATNFHNYTDLARQISAIGLVLYAVLMLLFVLLYPAAQRKAVWTMQTLGCTWPRRFAHVLLSAMAVVIPASVLGGFVGASLWERVVAALQATAESSVVLQLPEGAMAQLVLAQVAFSLILNMVVAIVVAAPRNISNRR